MATRRSESELRHTRLGHAGWDELFASLQVPAARCSAGLERLATLLREEDAQPLSLEFFGPIDAAAQVTTEVRRTLTAEVPLTWLGSVTGRDSPIAVHCHAVARAPVTPVRVRGRTVGGLVEVGGMRMCRLGNVTPEDGAATQREQTASVFAQLRDGLHSAGLDVCDLRRTWFHVDDIQSWYGDFNSVRDASFAAWDIHPALLPASTGVGGPNPEGSAIACGALAVRGDLRATGVASPLQGPAPAYGSAFSRAIELAWPDHRRLLVSGTASILPDGQTASPGEFAPQIERTFDVVAALLESRGMHWPDVIRAVAYVHATSDRAEFEVACSRRGLGGLPWLLSTTAICRSDLLVECEVDAVRSIP